ncbi:MAG: endonuclease III [Deltaproteobacteria bacterium]|nr:endonuclease III [Deltaproteobacteria bacterium]MBW2500440.1 endonuclease III [Deltaproteobacteria bacterium]
MKRAEKAARILQILDELYPAPPIPLEHEDPFTLLVAVVLSAQTTDERVNQVTPALFARARTPREMAKLPVEEILAAIRTCGLAPGKARNLKRLSEILVEDYDGEVPRDMEALESLPGVGHKTASVVMAQAFGVPAFPVDTHIHRLAARWGLSDGRSVEKTERDLKAVFPEEAWTRAHLSIIYFGREYCPARGHDLSSCPICCWAATRKRMAEEARVGGGGPASRAALAGGQAVGKKETKKKAGPKKKVGKRAAKKRGTRKAAAKGSKAKKPGKKKAAPRTRRRG